jgi:glutamine amidotransferase
VRVAVIDYGSGNLRSAAKALQRAALESEIESKIVVTGDPDVVERSDRIVLPGVGAFADCQAGLFAIDGMGAALRQAVEVRAVPFLGICVGMQLMATRGLEKVTTPGFGWIGGDVVLMQPDDPTLKIPQIGWNTLDLVRGHPIVDGIAVGPEGLHGYFVHSYRFAQTDRADVVASADYGGAITAIVGRDNLVGTQFHPEKSQCLGLALLANFLKWMP